jgi:acetolactate synthase-1/2/3 large subunit
MVTKAFRVATEGVPGPVFLEVPVDLLYPEGIVEEWFLKESGVDVMKGPVGKVARAGMQAYLKHQFHMPHLGRGQKPPTRSELSNSAFAGIATLKEALAGASKPVLVIGSQAVVGLLPFEAQQLADAVTKIGVPTFLGGSARGLLGRRSDLQFRHKRGKALREADVVVVAGFPFDFRMGYGRKINSKANLISINLDPVALKKNRKPTLGIQEHPGRVLLALADRVSPPPERASWFATLKEREDARDAEIVGKANSEGPLVDPIHLFMRIEEKIADDSILIVDGGDFVATAAYIVRPRAPLSWLDPGVFGTLGVGGGFAVGAATSRPDAEVWIFYGDGSSAYSLAEFDSYVRHGLAPIAVIGTDASWQQIARDQIAILGDDVGTVLLRTDYHTVAEGYGGKGILLTDPARIDEVLDEAKALAAAGTPVCINVHLAKSDFREGSISI